MAKFALVGMVGMRYYPTLGFWPATAFSVKAGLQNLASSLIQLYLVVVWFLLYKHQA